MMALKIYDARDRQRIQVKYIRKNNEDVNNRKQKKDRGILRKLPF